MADKIRILIAEEQDRVRESMRNILSYESRVKIVGECKDGQMAIELAKKLHPDIVIVDMNIPELDGINVTEALTSMIPNILVIVSFEQGAKKNLKRAMAAGAREYIVKPFTADGLMETVINLYDHDIKRRTLLAGKIKDKNIQDKPKIISVFSTKGGVGKSTIASNLAIGLAKKTKSKVALVDLDLQFGDISIMLNLNPERTIADLVKEAQSIDSEILEEYLLEHPLGLKILSAPVSPEHAEYITPGNIEKILKALLKNYKYIIVDTAPTFNEINLTTLDLSDQILFISTLDLPTIKNVKVGLSTMKSLSYNEDKIMLALNRYHRKFGVSTSDLEKTTGKEIAFVIPEDTGTVINAANIGNPFVFSKSNSTIAKSIQGICQYITGEEEGKESLLKRFIGK